MKRGTKIWLIVALIFGIIGGGLCLSAVILGVSYDDVRTMVYDGDFTWQIGPFRILRILNVKEEKSSLEKWVDADGQEKVTLFEDTELLQIDMDYGSLIVKASDSGETWLDGGDDAEYFEWSYDGSTLAVRNRERNFDWFNMDVPKATLYIPSGSNFEYVDIGVDAGSCTMEIPVRCGAMAVDVDAGSANLKNVTTDWLELDCDAGKIVFKGKALNGGDVDVDAGTIEMELTGADITDYNYDIYVNAGSLSINDKSFSGLEEQTYINNNGAADWALGCDAGKISIQIKNK